MLLRTQGAVHPTYSRMWEAWLMAEYTYLGGEQYRNPDYLTWDWQRPESGKSDFEEDETGFKGRTVSTNYSFLRPFDHEAPWQYQNRLTVAIPPSIVTECIDKVVAFVLSQKIERTANSVRALEDLWRDGGDADFRGTPWSEVVSDMLRGAMTQGIAHAIIDIPTPEHVGLLARIAERLGVKRTSNMQPYVRIKSPLEIPRWHFADDGELDMLEVLEEDTRPDPRDPWGVVSRPPLARIWTRESWALCDSTGKPVAREGGEPVQGPNPYGFIPIVSMYCRRPPGGDRMWGLTPTLTAIYEAQDLFNVTSEIQSALRSLYAFPVVSGTTDKSQAEIGTDTALILPPGSALNFVAPPSDPVDVLIERARSIRESVRAMYGLGRGRSEESVEARSGTALLVETSERASIVMALAQQARSFEMAVARTVARMTGATMDAEVRYPETYDVESLAEKVQASAAILGLPGIEAPAAQAIRDDVVRVRLRGVYSEKEVAAIMASIEALREPVEVEDDSPVVLRGEDVPGAARKPTPAPVAAKAAEGEPT